MNTVQEAVKVLLSSLCMEMRETIEFSERQSFFFLPKRKILGKNEITELELK